MTPYRIDKKTSTQEVYDLRNFKKKGNFYIMGDIDETIPINIIAPLQLTIENKIASDDTSPIKVYITSNGGWVDMAFDIVGLFEHAKAHGIPIHTYVMSAAYSAGSIIAVAGSVRFVTRRASHLIHYPRGSDYSDSPVMAQRNLDWYKFLSEEMIVLYEKYCKIPNLREKLLTDNYMVHGPELLKFKVADKYYD